MMDFFFFADSGLISTNCSCWRYTAGSAFCCQWFKRTRFASRLLFTKGKPSDLLQI